MAVNITFSLTENGEALTSFLDLGEGGFNGDNPSAVTLWLRHDGEQTVVNPKLYIAPFSGTYTGVTNAQEDYDALLGQSGLYSGQGYLADIYVDITGVGDAFVKVTPSYAGDLEHGVALPNIPAGSSIKIKVKVVFHEGITTDNVLGLRELDLRLTYTYTS